MNTNTDCEVCGYSIIIQPPLCIKCREQKQQMEEIKRQRLRDAAFGNPFDPEWSRK